MRRHEVLEQLHTVLQPRTYLEIGVHDGRSVALSRVPTVGVDPVNVMKEPVNCDLEFVESTSDAFFMRPDPLRHLPGRKVDLAFIDGMHLFEFALRDFINVEKHSQPGTVVLMDDMLPRKQVEALRNRRTKAWTGDVYKMIPVLERYRPDLLCVPLNSAPTGVMLVFGLDSSNSVLSEAYDEIIAEWLTEDPQRVPDGIIRRAVATPPRTVLEADFWPAFIAARNRRVTRPGNGSQRVVRRVRRGLAGEPSLGRLGQLRAIAKPRTRVRRALRQVRGGSRTRA